MRRALSLVLAAVLVLAATPADAARGRARVTWTKIHVPEGADAYRHKLLLKRLLDDAVRRADFGKAQKVSARVRIAELAVQRSGDLVRIRCTLVGNLEGVGAAKSRIAFGGAPEKERELEKQVLTMVANGLVTRLAEMSRNAEAKAAKAAADRAAAGDVVAED